MEENKNIVSKGVALFVTTLSSFLTTFMASSINIALPTIGKEFAIDTVMLGWIATAYILAAAIFLVPFGKLADIYGRKKIYTFGVIVYAFSSLISTLAPNEIVLIIARGLQGLGGAMIFGTAVAILTSVFPANERGKAIGSQIILKLREFAIKNNLKPSCGCAIENLASRKAIEKSGYVSRYKMINFKTK